MMVDYHIGSLSEEDRLALADGEAQPMPSAEPATYFLESRYWKRSTLHSKTTVSWDTRVFRFKLEHESQTLGLPTGQHMMIRLRDPVTREMIIRSYTPISAVSEAGYVDVLVKIYFDTKERKGGKIITNTNTGGILHRKQHEGTVTMTGYKVKPMRQKRTKRCFRYMKQARIQDMKIHN